MTISSVLVARVAKEKESLYDLFGLSVSDNNDNDVYLKGAKSCYKNDVVYGIKVISDLIHLEMNIMDLEL